MSVSAVSKEGFPLRHVGVFRRCGLLCVIQAEQPRSEKQVLFMYSEICLYCFVFGTLSRYDCLELENNNWMSREHFLFLFFIKHFPVFPTRCLGLLQEGVRAPLEVFKTATKGWGVRATATILEGTYICTYAGEVRVATISLFVVCFLSLPNYHLDISKYAGEVAHRGSQTRRNEFLLLPVHALDSYRACCM